MSTQRKLWLGFGILLSILVVVLVGMAIWLRALVGTLREVTARAEPARQAAYEMEVHNVATGLDVLSYLHTGAAGYRTRALQEASEFRHFQGEYQRLSPDKEDIAKQIAAVYEEFFTLGTRLMDRRDRQNAPSGEAGSRPSENLGELDEDQQGLQEFFYLRIRLDTLIDEGALKPAQGDVAAAGRSARDAVQGILAAVLLLLVAGFLVSTVTAVLVSRGIVGTEQTLRVTLSSIGDAVIATDRSGHVTFMNRVAEALTGWTQQEAVSRPLLEVFRIVDEETHQPRADPSKEVIRRGSVLEMTGRTVLIARDGTERQVEDSAAPILDEDQGKVSGVVLVFRDASQRRQSEQALKDADQRKDEFLAMLAHELRNPLAPLRNGLYVLKTPGVDAATVDRVLEMMVRQVQNMTRMIDDLLDVSRITRGKIELRKELVDLGPLVARVTALFRPEFDAAERQLMVSVPGQAVHVEADATRLEQIVGNLLSNALKYTVAGGHTWVSVEGDVETATVRVRDDGVGISPEMLPQIFDLFAQANSTMARSQGGLGIGLTLVRNLVEMHQGKATAHSAGLGEGSEFVVRLPRAQGAAPEARQPSLLPLPPSPLRVLVVDDNVDSADSLAVLLSLRGHEVHTAHDGRAALEMAESIRPHLVLLDIGLPEVDGYEVARRIRESERLQQVVLVAMTGYGRPEDRQRSQEAGFHHHLVKPVDLGALQSLLQALGAWA